MELQCPKCKKEFDYQPNPTLGIPDDHNEHPCPNCGQLLIWDYPQVHGAPGGPVSKPEECHHAQLKRSGAKVPSRP